MTFAALRRGRHANHPARQRYQCHGCEKRFDDLTDTVFEGHHQPLHMWMLCLYFMGLNLSNDQIANEWDVNSDDVYHMTMSLRQGVQHKKTDPLERGSRMRRSLRGSRAQRGCLVNFPPAVPIYMARGVPKGHGSSVANYRKQES